MEKVFHLGRQLILLAYIYSKVVVSLIEQTEQQAKGRDLLMLIKGGYMWRLQILDNIFVSSHG